MLSWHAFNGVGCLFRSLFIGLCGNGFEFGITSIFVVIILVQFRIHCIAITILTVLAIGFDDHDDFTKQFVAWHRTKIMQNRWILCRLLLCWLNSRLQHIRIVFLIVTEWARNQKFIFLHVMIPTHLRTQLNGLGITMNCEMFGRTLNKMIAALHTQIYQIPKKYKTQIENPNPS